MDELGAVDLVARWRGGDQQAATELFRRYAGRLIGLARSRLSAKVSLHVDPEDVVQSAYRSFFADTRDGRYEFQADDHLWQLLVTITLHKLQHQVERLTAQKRHLDRERHFGSEESLHGIQAGVLADDPMPVAAVALTDEVQRLMSRLEPLQRRMVEMRLQGFTLDEIAAETRLCQRTVRRVLEGVRRDLERPSGGGNGR